MTARSDLLIRLVREHGWTRGVELGVFKGVTFFALLDAIPELHMIGVDTWRSGHRDLECPQHYKRTDRDDGYRAYAGEDMPGIGRAVYNRAWDYGGRARLLVMPTRPAASYIEDRSQGFVFIDADHTERGVREDIVTWRPKLRPGGWLLGHDRSLPSVRAAIDSAIPGWRRLDGDCWAFETR